jgi:predicted transcriptional regulator
VAHTQERFKENNQIRKAILQSLQEKSKTVPEIAAEVSMPTPQVLWHLTAYKKYDIVVEDGMDGDYVLYKKVEKVD